MQLKPYQTAAVEDLTHFAKRFLREDDGKTLVLQAPTGSGKTIIIAEFLRQLTAADKYPALQTPVAFIWVAPNKLHAQSIDKVRGYYAADGGPQCVSFAELTDNQIGANQVLFFNWASVTRKDNRNIRENEFGRYLDNIIHQTKVAGRAVVLIRDESHWGNRPDAKAAAVVDAIAANLKIHVSATPKEWHADHQPVKIDKAKVQAAQMIKAGWILNDCYAAKGRGMRATLDDRPNDFILKAALKKRAELKNKFAAAGARVNPLVLVQLPSKKQVKTDDARLAAEELLARQNITYANGKLAVHLSADKQNTEGIDDNLNSAEVMLFKEAIALGWDCPRAHILVLFREWHDGTFSLQTLGRIMRVPEPATGYYRNAELNSAFVYTNQHNFMLDKKDQPPLPMYKSLRADGYEKIALRSVHRPERREKTRLTPAFVDLFIVAAEEYKLENKIIRENQLAEFVAIPRTEVGDAEQLGETAAEYVGDVKNPEYVQEQFDYFVHTQIHPFYPEGRSLDRMQQAIYKFLNFPLQPDVDLIQAAHIVLSRANKPHFINALTAAKDKYKTEIVDAPAKPLAVTEPWEIAEEIIYNENHQSRKVNKSIMRPFYFATNESAPEKEFIKFLENSAKIKWWYKNGARESMYFAVPYVTTGEEHPFYVDFIAQFADGRIGLFDTKQGVTLVGDAGDKSDGLLAYIQTENAKGKKLTGGLVTPANANNYAQGWKIYDRAGAELNSKDLSNWKLLEL